MARSITVTITEELWEEIKDHPTSAAQGLHELAKEALRNRQRDRGLEQCEGCCQWFDVESMHIDEEGVWLCDEDWKGLLAESSK